MAMETEDVATDVEELTEAPDVPAVTIGPFTVTVITAPVAAVGKATE